MQRRQFLKTSCILGLAGGSALLSACGTAVYYAKHSLSEQRISVAKTEFQYATKKGDLRTRDFVLIKPTGSPFPISVYHMEGSYIACLMRCTHQACEVEVQGSRYACPCHGSEFDVQGTVLSGPADQDLKTFKILEDETHIHILLA